MTFDELLLEVKTNRFTKTQAEKLVSAIVLRIEDSQQNTITFPADGCKLCGKPEHHHDLTRKYCYYENNVCPDGSGSAADFNCYNLRYIGKIPVPAVRHASDYEAV